MDSSELARLQPLRLRALNAVRLGQWDAFEDAIARLEASHTARTSSLIIQGWAADARSLAKFVAGQVDSTETDESPSSQHTERRVAQNYLDWSDLKLSSQDLQLVAMHNALADRLATRWNAPSTTTPTRKSLQQDRSEFHALATLLHGIPPAPRSLQIAASVYILHVLWCLQSWAGPHLAGGSSEAVQQETRVMSAAHSVVQAWRQLLRLAHVLHPDATPEEERLERNLGFSAAVVGGDVTLQIQELCAFRVQAVLRLAHQHRDMADLVYQATALLGMLCLVHPPTCPAAFNERMSTTSMALGVPRAGTTTAEFQQMTFSMLEALATSLTQRALVTSGQSFPVHFLASGGFAAAFRPEHELASSASVLYAIAATQQAENFLPQQTAFAWSGRDRFARQADWALGAMSRLDSPLLSVYSMRVCRAIEAKNWAQAETLLREGVGCFNPLPVIQSMLLGCVEFNRSKYEQAAISFQQALGLGDANLQCVALYNLAMTWLAQGDASSAEEALRKAITNHEARQWRDAHPIHALWISQTPFGAMMVQFHTDSPKVLSGAILHLWLARCLVRQQRWSSAVIEYRRARDANVAAEIEENQLVEEMSHALLNGNQPEECLAVLDSAPIQNSPWRWSVRAEALARLRQFPDALAAVDSGLGACDANNPMRTVLLNNRIVLLLLARRVFEAQEAANRATSLVSRDETVAYNATLLVLLLGTQSQGRDALRRWKLGRQQRQHIVVQQTAMDVSVARTPLVARSCRIQPSVTDTQLALLQASPS